ncbi:MAG: hypothetical protein KAW89_03435 [Armatimonadetes bacterium]|nr:hypothetical protein [Armatimonadota bacterium]
MKPRTRRFGLITGFLLVFVAGCVVGLFGASWLWYRHVFGSQVDQAAVNLSIDIHRASQLRLGEADAALDDLEVNIDNAIVSAGLTPHIPITELRRRQLRKAKTYREMYPSRSALASQVAEALAKVQRIEIDQATCDTPFCRLVRDAESRNREQSRLGE